MSTADYQLQARALVLIRGHIERDETRVLDNDDPAELRRAAANLVADGFTTWLFRRHGIGFDAHLRLIETQAPTAARAASARHAGPIARGSHMAQPTRPQH